MISKMKTVLIPTALLLALPFPAASQAVWGTRPGEVMVTVSSVFSQESEVRLWHEPLRSVAVHSKDALKIEIGPEALLFYVPVTGGDSAQEMKQLIESSQGELLRLEYHPADATPRGRVQSSWTLSPKRTIAGTGAVPMTNRLYSAMLRYLGDDVPDSGVFAPLSAAQRRLELLERNVALGNGREVDQLRDEFIKAADNAGLPLEFYKLKDGSRASEEAVQAIVHRGYELSALDYWNAAISKYRQNRLVNPTLNEFEKAWEKVPESSRVMAEFPGSRRKKPLSDEALHQFRVAAAQKYLDAAAQAATAEDSEWTVEMLRRFHEEQEIAQLPMSDYQVDGRPAEAGDPDLLIRRARLETGFVGWFRAIWHRILAASMPNATPT
ncbi:MAG: hypothetical protein HKN12_03525 [Gemmatimonadetes bacterium]|nr:hypothetical protein [Gemmatimonadota bacterium]